MTKQRICPKCKSTDVSPNLSSQAVAIGTFQNEYICNKCGYESMFFPEIETKKTKKKQ
jgi:RNase P subunit RPR2